MDARVADAAVRLEPDGLPQGERSLHLRAPILRGVPPGCRCASAPHSGLVHVVEREDQADWAVDED